MTTDELLKQGISALKIGQKAKARQLLSQSVKQDSYNEQAWLWLSGAVDTDKERIDCLKNVLAINPSNKIAQQEIDRLQNKTSQSSQSETTMPPEYSHPFTNLFEDMICRIELPQQKLITPEGQKIFKRGMDKANEYRGDPGILWEALNFFQQSDSLPLFYIGAAYVHFVGSYEENITYHRDGLQVARLWLQRASELTPDAKELLTVQAYVDIHSHDDTAAHNHLTHLRKTAPYDFYVLTAYLDYYAVKQDLERMTATYKEALPLAKTITRRAYLQNRVGRYYLMFRKFDKSLEVYRDLAKITPADPWMWHNMSVIYMNKKKTMAAWRCNKKALQIMDFENARIIRASIHGALIRGAIGYGLIVIFWLVMLWQYREVIFK